MLLHSQLTTDYLNRRHRLFQLYSQPQPQPQSPNFSHNQSYSIENVKLWLNSFGQIILNQKFRMHGMKNIVNLTQPSCIYVTRQQIITMIKLCINYLPASKISNTLYYLCRRSIDFRTYLTQQLQTQYFNLSNHTWTKLTSKLCIILTDIFVFGVYFTQAEFVANIFMNVLKGMEECPISLRICQQDQYKYERIIFQLHYLSHYLEILTLPSILSIKYRQKILQRVHQYITELLNKILSGYKKQMYVQLHKLQQIYTHPTESSYYKQNQQAYMKKVYRYESVRVRVLAVIQGFVSGGSYKNNGDICADYSFQALQQIISNQFQPVLYRDQNNSHQKQDRQSTANQDAELESGSSDRDKSDSFKKDQQDEQNKNQQKRLLTKIYNNCKYYANATTYQKDHLYTLPPIDTIPSYNTPSSIQGYIFLEQIPEMYLESLNNCTDISTADTLSHQFLQQYNKHCNRVKLVNTVMRQLYERINIGYIVRVLAVVRLVERDEIDELVEEEMRVIGERSCGRLSKGQYGRYAQLIIELIKFNITPAQPYLKTLLSLLQLTHTPTPTTPDPQTEPSTPSTRPHTFQPITFIETIITLIQKLGRELYYHSLPTHIIFNQIIGYIYHHIRTKTVCYDMDTVNRFNGLVLYLQGVRKDEEEKKAEILLVSYLKNQKNFKNQVKNIQRSIKKDYNDKDGVTRMTEILEYSIEKQNYMDSYLYADLIYQVGSKKLDESVKKLAIKQIRKQLDEGNYQGATNWSRFYGELHRYQIFNQKEFINFLNNTILDDYFNKYPAASIKVISTAIEACQCYMKNTNKISEISETLTFLLTVKKQLLKIRGLKNSILEQEIEDILEYFHEGFKYVRSVDDCTRIQKRINGKNCDVEKLMNEYEDQSKLNDQKLEKMRLKQKIEQENTEKYLGIVEDDTAVKYVQKQQKPLYRQKNTSPDKIDELEKSELLTNSSNKTNTKLTQLQPVPEQQQKPKKIKIITRSKTDNKKLEKVQIMI